MVHFAKPQIQAGAKSANEQQDTPSKKPCNSKTEGVIFRTIQRTSEVLTIDSFALVNQRYSTGFSRSPRLSN
jgi:hypothetical protein